MYSPLNLFGYWTLNKHYYFIYHCLADIAMGFNQRKPTDQTICVAVDLSAEVDSVCHNNMLSKINRSQLPPGHSAIFILLSKRKTSQDMLQRCKVVVSTHSLDPCLWGESDHPAFGPPASLSLHLQRGLSTNPGLTVWCVCGCS